MAENDFAAYGYQLDKRVRNLTFIALFTALLAVLCASMISPWCLLLLLVTAGIIFHILRSVSGKPLLIAPRYLILGDRIMYYRNVTRAHLDNTARTLTLESGHGRSLVLAADNFPTNARKPDKIKANKSAKFEKVSGKIISRLKEVSPGIVIS